MAMTENTISMPVVSQRVVAIVPAPAAEIGDEMNAILSTVEQRAASLVIETDEDYEGAAEFGRELKNASAQVVEFFKPIKKAANEAHKTACASEKTMLAPLTNAEALLKQTMGSFVMRKERERQEIEARARLRAKEDSDKMLEDAIIADESGDTAAAESAMADAQMAHYMSQNITIHTDALKATGVSTSKGWTIGSVNPDEVPIELNGVVLRPVDEKTIMRLIKASKGTITIPGIRYKEEAIISIRR